MARATRLSAYEIPPDWRREAWRELPEACELRLFGEGTQDGHSTFIIDAIPRQDYQPRSGTANLFPSLMCRFWVDQQGHQILKLEVAVVDTIWMGLFLVRVAKGSRVTLETRVSDGVWIPIACKCSPRPG